jgi:maltose alpha-D-glucosyltransferase/alpha-amylase
MKKTQSKQLLLDPTWYKDAVIYELNVKSFYDSNGDGIGDFQGLAQKLDYLQNLGVTAVWLLPFYPSPQRDDGYDIADYYGINPDYGTLNDFKILLKEAHQRGIRVITELVVNHTSDQHEWFKKSRRAKPGTSWRNFYVWSDTPDKYQDARIIFKDFEQSNWAWDPVAKAYYWHRFYSHQPDLNFDNPEVQRSVIKAMDYWFEMGVDGMRLDAIPYLFEREGTNCENLPETYAFLEKLRAHVDRNYRGKMLLAEANQWPEDAVAYFGDGNRCHMAFHFPVMPRLFMASWMEDRFPIIDIFEQTPAIPEQCQWALFLRNHDELTLEMVSDEERDYMYRVFAKDPATRINLGIRRRLAPLLGNNRRKIELMNILLFSLPGTPVLYYGDEIGMGDNHYLGDRNGVRTPMQWNGDRNAGFSRANPQRLFLPAIIDPDYHYEAVNVENQQRNQSSLFWWMKRVISMRKKFKAFGRGTLEFLPSKNPKVLTFIRHFEDEIILVVANLSRFSQAIELDLSTFEGYVPEEVVSGNKFPTITKSPYLFTLGFYDYYWFSLQKEEKRIPVRSREDVPVFVVDGHWDSVLEGKNKDRFERDILPAYLESIRWFGGKARALQQARITERIPVHMNSLPTELIFVDVRYTEGSNETYLLPLSFLRKEEAHALNKSPQAIIAVLKTKAGEGILYDAAYHDQFRKNLLTLVTRKFSVKGNQGELVAYAGKGLQKRKAKDLLQLPTTVLKAEQSNTSMMFGSELLMKLYRKLDEGINPDLEIGRFLTEEASFANVPAFAGGLEYRRHGAEPIVLGILQDFVQNQGDAWTFTLHHASSYFEQIQARKADIGEAPRSMLTLLNLSKEDFPPLMQELIGGFYLEMARLIGKRTGEMHLALAAEPDDHRFSPEPFSLLYQRSLYHSMRTLTRRVFDLLNRNLSGMSPNIRSKATVVAPLEKEIIAHFSRLFSKKIPSVKIRVHGDYHLGQVLFTGNDFVIIDFEGEPARSIGERRLKRSPLRDVAGMIRSFHYPAYSILYGTKTFSPEEIAVLEPWAECWYKFVASAFLRTYLETVKNASFIPSKDEDLELLLNAYLLEKAIYEVAYELNNRPDWVTIPLKGIADLMGVAQ